MHFQTAELKELDAKDYKYVTTVSERNAHSSTVKSLDHHMTIDDTSTTVKLLFLSFTN